MKEQAKQAEQFFSLGLDYDGGIVDGYTGQRCYIKVLEIEGSMAWHGLARQWEHAWHGTG